MHTPIDAACERSGVWPCRSLPFTLPSAPCRRLTPVIVCECSDSSTWPSTTTPCLAVRNAERKLVARPACVVQPASYAKKHSTPPRLQARLAPGSATPAQTGVAVYGKLGLEIISGIKGAQPCHPTMR